MIYKDDFISGFRFILRHRVFTLLRVLSLVPGMTGMMAYWILTSAGNAEAEGAAAVFNGHTWEDAAILLLICFLSCLVYGLVCFKGRNLKFSRVLTLKVIYGGSGKDVFMNILAESFIILTISILIALAVTGQWLALARPLPEWEAWIGGVATAKLFALIFIYFVNCAFIISYLYSKIKVSDLMKTKI